MPYEYCQQTLAKMGSNCIIYIIDDVKLSHNCCCLVINYRCCFQFTCIIASSLILPLYPQRVSILQPGSKC